MTQRKYKPVIYYDIPTLQKVREANIRHLEAANIKKRNLDQMLANSAQYSQFYKANPLPKKAKTDKIGLNGMNELTNVILNMKKDIKQIKDAQSLEGARAWVEKHGPELYGAARKDINGDNIPDIVIQRKDSKGNLIPNNYAVVNGYTTVESTYPYRNAYYEEYPTREARKQAREDGITYQQFIRGMYNPQYEDNGMGQPKFANQAGKAFEAKLKKSGYTKIIRPGARSPYQAFVSLIIKPIYEALKYFMKNMNGLTLAKLAAPIWNNSILAVAMSEVYGMEVLDNSKVDDEAWKRLRNKKEVKEAIKTLVIKHIENPHKLIELVPAVLDLVNQAGYNLPENAEEQVVDYLQRIVDPVDVDGMKWSEAVDRSWIDDANKIPIDDDDNDFLA